MIAALVSELESCVGGRDVHGVKPTPVSGVFGLSPAPQPSACHSPTEASSAPAGEPGSNYRAKNIITPKHFHAFKAKTDEEAL